MPELEQARAKAQDLALVASAWKFRIFGYVTEEHTLKTIETLGFFQKASANILPGNFVFINDKDGKAAMRVFAQTEPEDEKNKDFKPLIYLKKPD